MNRLLTLLLAASCLTAVGQIESICGCENENSLSVNLNLVAPEGYILGEVLFASYGTPTGDCENEFAIGDCHAPATVSVIESYISDSTTSLSVYPNNQVFGDPCSQINKKLCVEIAIHVTGCMNADACNYNPEASWDDGTCVSCEVLASACGVGTVWDPTSQTCIVDESACGWQPDGNGDNLIGVNDLLDLLGVYGDTDYDQDGIWDSADDCVGEYDECGVCNGSGPSIPIIESIEILYDSVYAEPINEWLVFEVGADTTFSYTCFAWQCGDPLEYQGYDYETVQIGEQCWFAENLRTLTYANDDSLEFNLTGVEWSQTANGAAATYGEGPGFCNSVAPNMNACDELVSLQFYGRLYNWLAVDDARGLCPTGWHVGSEQDFDALITAMGGEGPASWALRETFGWEYDANGFLENGWGALPGGFRSYNSSTNAAVGYFAAAGSQGGWWTSTGNGENASWYRLHSYYTGEMPRYNWNVNVGFSVRCIKDSE